MLRTLLLSETVGGWQEDLLYDHSVLVIVIVVHTFQSIDCLESVNCSTVYNLFFTFYHIHTTILCRILTPSPLLTAHR